jgi:aspartyl aminopeptidase
MYIIETIYCTGIYPFKRAHLYKNMSSFFDVCRDHKEFQGTHLSRKGMPKKDQDYVLGNFFNEYSTFLKNPLSSDVSSAVRKYVQCLRSDSYLFMDDKDMGISGAVGSAFAFVKLGKPGAPVRIAMAHTDVPALKIASQPICTNIDAEKSYLSRNVSLKALPYGGIRPENWYGIPVNLVGRIYANENDIGKKIDLWGKIEERSVHTEDSSEMKGHSHLKINVGAKNLKELYKLFGLKNAMDFGRMEVFAYPDLSQNPRNGLIDGDFMGFGHDDRAGVFSIYKALADICKEKKPTDNTIIGFGLTNEEIGSTSSSGAFRGFFEATTKEVLKRVYSSSKTFDLPLDFNRGLLGGLPALSVDTDVGLSDQEMDDSINVDYLEGAKIGWGPFINAHDSSWLARRASPRHVAGLMKVLSTSLPGTNKQSRFQITGNVHTPDSGLVSGTMSDQFDSILPMIDMGIPVSGLHTPRGETLSMFDLYWLKESLKAYMKA